MRYKISIILHYCSWGPVFHSIVAHILYIFFNNVTTLKTGSSTAVFMAASQKLYAREIILLMCCSYWAIIIDEN